MSRLHDQTEYAQHWKGGCPVRSDPEYTPSTETVRATYASDYYMTEVRGGAQPEERAERFDRWLAAEKAKWQAEALREFADDILSGDTPWEVDTRGARWVHDEAIRQADRIEKGSDDGR